MPEPPGSAGCNPAPAAIRCRWRRARPFQRNLSPFPGKTQDYRLYFGHADHQFSDSPTSLRPSGLRCSRRRDPGQPHRRLWRLHQGQWTIHLGHDSDWSGRVRVVHGEAGHPRDGRHELGRPAGSGGWSRRARRIRPRIGAGRKRRVGTRHHAVPFRRGDPGPVARRPAGVPEPAPGGSRLRARGHQPRRGRLPQLPPVAWGDVPRSREPDLDHHGGRLLDDHTGLNHDIVDDNRRRGPGHRGPGARGPGYLEPDRSGGTDRLRPAAPRPRWDHHLIDDRRLVVTAQVDTSQGQT